MIATWLVEIYLNKINMLEDQTAASAGSDEARNFLAEQKFLEEEFRVFLDTHKVNNNEIVNVITYLIIMRIILLNETHSIEQANLDKRTTYNLIASHGRVDELLFYATIIGDYEKVISNWIQEKDYKKALDVLSKQVSLL